MLTLTRCRWGWMIEYRVDGVRWWTVTYQTAAEAREALRRMGENECLTRAGPVVASCCG